MLAETSRKISRPSIVASRKHSSTSDKTARASSQAHKTPTGPLMTNSTVECLIKGPPGNTGATVVRSARPSARD